MALIEMKGVTKKYHRSTTALRDINVSINPGEFVYIVGPSGAGKSSFIKAYLLFSGDLVCLFQKQTVRERREKDTQDKRQHCNRF